MSSFRTALVTVGGGVYYRFMAFGAVVDHSASALSRRLENDRSRGVLYTLLLAVAACIVIFTDLGGSSLTGDEAQYALCVRDMRRTGDWMIFSPAPPMQYLQKPPLYLWLTRCTWPLFGETELTYRIWSGAFGVLCVAFTCALGASMLGAEVGLVAGLLLLTNRMFLFKHGMRSGTFDAAVGFFWLAGAWFYWMVLTRRLRWSGWIAIGVLAGLATLAKPLMGVPLWLSLSLHAAFDRGAPRRLRFGGSMLALLGMLVIAGPWYLAQYLKFGDVFIDQMFKTNIVQRALVGLDRNHLRDPSFYLHEITASSLPFALFGPAMLLVLVASFRGSYRQAFGLLSVLVLGLMAMLTCSASKLLHYSFPAFGFIAIAIAAMCAALLGMLSQTVREPQAKRRITVTAWGVVALGLLLRCTQIIYRDVAAYRETYAPWELYQTLSPAMQSGRVRMVFVDFPASQLEWRQQLFLMAHECYYFERMREQSQKFDATSDLAAIAAQHQPALLALPKRGDAWALYPQTGLSSRISAAFVEDRPTVLLAGVDLENLLQPRWQPDSPSDDLKVEGSAEAKFDGQLVVTLAPPLIEDAVLSVNVKLENANAAVIRYAAYLDKKKLADERVRPVNDDAELVLEISQHWWDGPRPRRFLIKLYSSEANADPVRGRVTAMKLALRPPSRPVRLGTAVSP